MTCRILMSCLACFALAMLAAVISTGPSPAAAQAADEKKEGPQDDQDKPAEQPAPLTRKQFQEFMDDDVKGAWNRLRLMERRRMGDSAAQAADKLVELAPRMLRYDGEVLRGEKKGQKAREQQDYKDWVEAIKKHAAEYAKQARAGDWDKAVTAREEINKTCNACHDAYEP